jgi:uncharacterized protein YjiS (DUF1127 family)
MISPMSFSKSPVRVAVLFRAVRANLNAAVAFVRAAWNARRHRHEVTRLLAFDDHALRDIGLTRGDVLVSLAGPVFDDPSTRLRILAVERRAARRARAREWPSRDRTPAPQGEQTHLPV